MNYNIYLENTKKNQHEKIIIEYNGITTYDGSIIIVDNYLSRFKNLESLTIYLYNEKQIDFIPNKCYIINKKDINNKLDPIFNDNNIKTITSDLLSHKELHINWNYINELINNILNNVNNVYKSISNTKEINKLYYYFINNKINELKILLHNDYTLYRNLYIWFNNYKSKNNKEIKEKTKDNQITIDNYIKNKDKPYRLISNYLNDIEEENNKELIKEINDKKNRFNELREKGIYTNDLIEYYYNNGGLSSVLENVSLDDIELLTKDEQEYIGFRKK